MSLLQRFATRVRALTVEKDAPLPSDRREATRPRDFMECAAKNHTGREEGGCKDFAPTSTRQNRISDSRPPGWVSSKMAGSGDPAPSLAKRPPLASDPRGGSS